MDSKKAVWQAEAALHLAQYAASAITLLVADLNHRKLLDPDLFQHFSDQLLDAAHDAPDSLQDAFGALEDMLEGLHYRTPPAAS